MVDISISDKQMKPAVVHTDQFADGVLCFTLADYMQNDKDLRKFNAYVVTSIKGVTDITQVPYTVSGRSLKITWSLNSYTLKDPGVIQYQIRFSQSEADGTAVWYSYKGVIINRLAINADDQVSANYPTLMKQWLDLMHTLAGEFGAPITYMLPGQSIPVEERLANRMYYQWLDTPNRPATCATGMVKLGKRPYADSGLYINNTHICVDTTNETAYVIDPAIWVNAINNADCGVVATDISDNSGIILLISAKEAGASGNSIGLNLDVATYGAGAGEVISDGEVIAMSGGYDSTVGVDNPRGRLEDSHGNTLHYSHLLEDFNFSKGTVQAQIDSLRNNTMFPNWSAKVDVKDSIQSGITMPCNAWLHIQSMNGDGGTWEMGIYLSVNGVEVMSTRGYDYGHPDMFVPVRKGDVVSVSVQGTLQTAEYFPMLSI